MGPQLGLRDRAAATLLRANGHSSLLNAFEGRCAAELQGVIRSLAGYSTAHLPQHGSSGGGGGGGPDRDGKSLFVFNVEGRRYNAPLLVGLLDLFQHRYPGVGFFQPIAGMPFPHSDSQLPRHVELLYSAFGLQGDPKAAFAVTRQECVDLLARGRQEELLDRVYDSFQRCRRQFDCLLLEGTHEDGPVGVPGDRLELNGKLAAALGSPVLMALDARPGQTAAAVAQSASIAKQHCQDERADVLGLVLNQVPPEARDRIVDEVSTALQPCGLRVFGGLPEDPLLRGMRLDAVAAELGTRLIAGEHALLDASADGVVVAAGSLTDVLTDMEATGGRPLVVAPASRPDIILGLAAVHAAGTGPHAAGLLVSDSDRLDERVVAALDATHRNEASSTPLLLSRHPITTLLRGLDSLKTQDMLPTSAAKIERSKTLVARHIDGEGLAAALDAPPEMQRQTPKAFIHSLQQKCMEQRQRIVLPEGTEPRILQAATEITSRGFADITLLGGQEAIQAEADKLGLDISACTVVDPAASPDRREAYIDHLCEARKHKGTTREMAADMLEDVNYWGTVAVAVGDADGMVSGSVHTTAATIRPGLQVLRTREQPLVSSVFFMCLPDRVLVYGDCAVNVSPSAQDLAHIAAASADTAAAFGVSPPRVALLSYSTGASGSGAAVDKVKEAVQLVRQQRPDLLVEGPLQYDAAVDPKVAAVKIKGESEVAGQANVLIFPDLGAANVGYKAVQQSTGAIAMGPIMQGLRLPVNDLSRGCTVPDIVNTIICTAVQAVSARSQ